MLRGSPGGNQMENLDLEEEHEFSAILFPLQIYIELRGYGDYFLKKCLIGLKTKEVTV